MYKFHSQLVLRTPVYSHQSYQEVELSQLLSTPYFQAAIREASYSLYRELNKCGFALEALPPGALLAVRKYLNRMCFRPTPFGLFSGVGTVPWGHAHNQPAVLPGDSLRAAVGLNYGETMQLAHALLLQELPPCQAYRSNTTVYRVQNELRYIRYAHDAASGKRNFFIDAVSYTGFLQAVLTFCAAEKRKEAVVHFIREALSADEAESSAFFAQLVEQQILVSTLEANITGEDYLYRLLEVCDSFCLDTGGVHQVRYLLESLASASGMLGTENIGCALLDLDRLFPHQSKTKSPLYVNLDLGEVSGELDTAYQRCMLEGLECLHRLVPTQQPQGLERFAHAMHEKFEGRAVPLLVALDPEIGVGYEDLVSGLSKPKLLEDLEPPAAQAGNPVLEWTPAHALLMEKWQSPANPVTTIQITEQDLELLPAESKPGKLPPSTSVLFRIVGDQVFMEQVGGASAAALLGRFTPVNDDIDALASTVAIQEQAANPHVLFAEITHTSDTHTANIDRRNVTRDVEIPVLVQSTLPPDRQIPLSDLWVRVEEGRVLLFSKKRQKEIVPRLSSAFNYLRNDLAAFRFLCDLQYQGLQANLTLDLSSFFPGMRFYPRVVYKSTILHLATWHLDKAHLVPVLAGSGEQGREALRQLAAVQGWPRHIAVTEHDHQLVIDLEREEDLTLFIQAIRQKEQVVVKEFPFVDASAPVVVDAAGKPFIHQFVAALYQEQEVYPMHSLPKEAGVAEGKRKLLPGDEWLYVKIYCHPSRANQLLTGLVLPLVNRLQKQGAVRQWFYVRYRDPDYHLRVRLSVSPEHVGHTLQLLLQKLSGQTRKGTVRDVQIASYERELERYGPAFMEAVEAFFCSSSALVAHSLKRCCDETDFAYYQAGFSGLELIASALTADLKQKETLFSGLYAGFYREFSGDKALRKQLSAKYRAVSSASVLPCFPPGALPGERPLRKFWRNMQATLQVIGQQAATLPAARKTQLAADLMHMHLNRVFVDEPRKQELVAYYCLWRHTKSRLARSQS